MFDGSNYELPSRTQELCNTVRKITYFYIVLLILRFLCGDFSVIFVDAMLVLMIFLFLNSVNYLMTGWCIFFILLAMFQSAVIVLLFLQNYTFGFITSLLNIYFILHSVQLIVYLMLIHHSFKVYKEYRALADSFDFSNRNEYRNIDM
jgi:hypothetical protein